MTRKLVVLIGVLALVITACGTGGDSTAGGQSEGIEVHGHWTIDVVNPDGTLDQRYEFDNELATVGKELLTRFLTGISTPGPWTIELVTESGKGCPSTSNKCIIAEADYAGTPDSRDLIVDGDILTDMITLSGSVVAAADTRIRIVRTNLVRCGGDVAPDNCIGSSLTNSLTFAFLVPEPQVATGQTVQVVVEISFG